MACQNNHLECVRELLPHADVNRASTDSMTPLLIAAEHGWADVVKALVGAGADMRLGNIFKQTPLLIAATQGKVTYEERIKLKPFRQ